MVKIFGNLDFGMNFRKFSENVDIAQYFRKILILGTIVGILDFGKKK